MKAKLYKMDALYGSQGVGFVFDSGDDMTFIGVSGIGCEFKANVLWPDVDFSNPAELDAEGRAGMLRRMTKRILSKRTEDEFTAAYIDTLKFFTGIGSSLECSWMQLHLMDGGVVYVDPAGKRQSLSKNSLMERALADVMLRKSGTAWEEWRRVHQANLKSNSAEVEIHKKMMSEGTDILYPWTKEDAEECASFYTEGHWLA